MDKKTRIGKLEAQIGEMDADPDWRLEVARDILKIRRRLESILGCLPEPEENIIANELKHLEHWPNEKAWKNYLDEITPMLNDLNARINANAKELNPCRKCNGPCQGKEECA